MRRSLWPGKTARCGAAAVLLLTACRRPGLLLAWPSATTRPAPATWCVRLTHSPLTIHRCS